MGKYTADDNRSMQLNDNNDRYYSSRGIDRDELFEDEELETTILEGKLMLLEFDNQIINTQRITHVNGELVDLTLRTVDEEHIVVYPTVRIKVHTDYRDSPISMDFTPVKRERDGEDYNDARSTYQAPSYSCYLPTNGAYDVHDPTPACFDPSRELNQFSNQNKKVSISEEDIIADINDTLNVYTRYVLKCMIKNQKDQLGSR